MSCRFTSRHTTGLSVVLVIIMLLSIPEGLRGEDGLGTDRIFRPVTEQQLPEIDQLRWKLQAAEAEIQRLTREHAFYSVSLLQDADAQPNGNAAGSGESGGSDLAKKSQNPISDLVSLPLQSNFDFRINPGNRTRYVGNFQPVIPIKLNEDWNLINRIIVPFVNAPIGPDLRSDGIGDTIGQFFFSPRKPGRIIWGIGPSVLFPTASDSTLGFQEWGAGINAVALVSEGPILTGVLVNQIWSFEGNTKPFLIQPFLNYNLPKGWFVSVSGEASADWERPSNARWIIPLGAGIGRVFPIFGQPVNISTRFAPYLEKPPGGPDWQFRFQITLLFPK